MKHERHSQHGGLPHQVHEATLYYTENEQDNVQYCGNCNTMLPWSFKIGNICPSCQHRFNERKQTESETESEVTAS